MAMPTHLFDPAPLPGDAVPKVIACLTDTLTSVAAGGASVFIIGERGTRTDLAARSVHALSPRAQAPFVSVNQPELTEAFVEQTLFGHGKLPGGEQGLIAQAGGGTLFLNEVCGFSPAIQARLARLLDAQRVQPDQHAHGGGVRLVAASRREPERALRDGLLHPELYEQLRIFVVRVPPLRERKPEILALAHDALAAQARASGIPVPRLSDAVISRLIAYDWPGNAHELEQAMTHAVIMSQGSTVEERHLPSVLTDSHPADTAMASDGDNLQSTLESVERTLIEEALRASHGNQARAAQRLGITERLMGLRVKKYGIASRHFRQGINA